MTSVTRYIGTCPVCEGEFRLLKERMVHHGYKRPGHGSIEGDCPGVGYPPYEVSTEGTERYLERVQRGLLQEQDFLARLQRGVVEKLQVPDYSKDWSRFPPMKQITAADGYQFEQAIRDKIQHTKYLIDGLRRESERCDRLIRDWRPRPVRTLEESIEREAAAKAERAAVRASARAARDAKKQATRSKMDAREQRERDFIARYRDKLQDAAARLDKHGGLNIWKRMHIEAKKEVSSRGRWLMKFVTEMKIDPQLIDLGLANVRGDYLNYADERGWLR